MQRLITKEQRQNVQKYEIESRTAEGWAREDYKKLVILTHDEEEKFSLFVLCGTAAHPIVNGYYRQEERRKKRIEDLKGTQDYRERRKAEEKANPRKSTAANCAAAIREELKKFKGVKFTVRSENFAGGNSVHIGWVDGPSAREVEIITDKYQYGHFDGMNDIYEYSNSREDIPQAKYVQTSRSQAEETRKVLDEAAAQIISGEPGWETDRNRNELSYRLFAKTSIPAGAKVLGIELSGQDCGSWDEIYRLKIEGGEQPAPAKEESAAAAVERVKFGPVQVIDYSAKAYAVTGDIKPIKDTLESLGGKFNKYLTCGPGYIFSKRTRPIEKTTAALQALRGTPTSEEVEATMPEETPETEPVTMAVTHRSEPRALLQAGIESGRVMIVTPQTPAAWSEHGAGKVHAQSDTARAIVREVEQIVKEASMGKVSSAQAMREAAGKIERIDSPKARELANSLYKLVLEHERKMEEVEREQRLIQNGYTRSEHPETPSGYLTPSEVKQYNTPAMIEARQTAPRMTAHGETKQMFLF